MRYTLIYTICFVLMGILGCSTIATKNIKKQDLYLHSFTCDSLGVEKSVFGRNEKWYAGFVIRNDSNYPIKYQVTYPVMLEVDYFRYGRASIRTFGDLDLEYELPVYILNPHEQIFNVAECHHDANVKVGKYQAKMYYFIIFLDDSYQKLAKSHLRQYIPFYVKNK